MNKHSACQLVRFASHWQLWSSSVYQIGDKLASALCNEGASQQKLGSLCDFRLYILPLETSTTSSGFLGCSICVCSSPPWPLIAAHNDIIPADAVGLIGLRPEAVGVLLSSSQEYATQSFSVWLSSYLRLEHVEISLKETKHKWMESSTWMWVCFLGSPSETGLPLRVRHFLKKAQASVVLFLCDRRVKKD